MERILKPTFEGNLALASFLLGSIRYPETVDAVICFPGEGENKRQDFAEMMVSEFRKNKPGTFFLVAGFGSRHKGYRIEGAIQQKVASNTFEQAVWAVEKMSQLSIGKAIIVTATYHMLRAYLTMLRQLDKQGFSASLFPAPVLPINIFFEKDRMEAEILRIKEYQEKGDVASLESLIMYSSRFYDA